MGVVLDAFTLLTTSTHSNRHSPTLLPVDRATASSSIYNVLAAVKSWFECNAKNSGGEQVEEVVKNLDDHDVSVFPIAKGEKKSEAKR